MLELKIRLKVGSIDWTAPSPDVIATDPMMRAAVTTVRQFDAFLAKHDAPPKGRIADGTFIFISPTDGSALFDGGNGIWLGGHPTQFARHSSQSPEIIGHELAHMVASQLGARMLGEGWADVVGAAFARSIDAPGSDNWLLGDDVFHPALVRDLEHPAYPTADDAAAYVANTPRNLHGKPDHDTHLSPGPLTRAAALLATTTSPEISGDVFTGAFLHDLGPRYWAAFKTRETTWHPDTKVTPPLVPIQDSYLRFDLDTAARATLDAAARMQGADSTLFGAVQDAWRGVGVDVEWAPLPVKTA